MEGTTEASWSDGLTKSTESFQSKAAVTQPPSPPWYILILFSRLCPANLQRLSSWIVFFWSRPKSHDLSGVLTKRLIGKVGVLALDWAYSSLRQCSTTSAYSWHCPNVPIPCSIDGWICGSKKCLVIWLKIPNQHIEVVVTGWGGGGGGFSCQLCQLLLWYNANIHKLE